MHGFEVIWRTCRGGGVDTQGTEGKERGFLLHRDRDCYNRGSMSKDPDPGCLPRRGNDRLTAAEVLMSFGTHVVMEYEGTLTRIFYLHVLPFPLSYQLTRLSLHFGASSLQH